MKKYYKWTVGFICIVVMLCFGNGIAVGQAPTISSFTPASGSPGTSVTINGSNFNATAGSNIVYFGATKATVTSASTSQLVVTVATGATSDPISVLNLANNLICLSTKSFIPKYSLSTQAITSSSFSSKIDFAVGSAPKQTVAGDLDGDGKSEIVSANYSGNSVSVLRNISSSGSINFASKIDLSVSPGLGPTYIKLADLNGDGKLDIVSVNTVPSGSTKTISVFTNASTVGNLAFTLTSLDLGIYNYIPLDLAVSDLDGDGKLDIVTIYNDDYVSYQYKMSIYRNFHPRYFIFLGKVIRIFSSSNS